MSGRYMQYHGCQPSAYRARKHTWARSSTGRPSRGAYTSSAVPSSIVFRSERFSPSPFISSISVTWRFV